MSDHTSLLGIYDAIVVGTGISGLTTALIMAKEGKKVALFERDDDIAPLIRPYNRKGCICSPGLHISGWMDENEPLSTFLNYLNVDDGVDRVLNQNCFTNISMGSKTYHIPRGLRQITENLIAYFPDSAEAIRAYMDLVEEVNDGSFFFNHILAPKQKNYEYQSAANYSLEDFLLQYKANSGLIDLLGTLNHIFVGSKADEVPFATHAFVFGGFYRSPGFIPINGVNRLLSNFKRELTRYGVDILLNSEVEEILVNNERRVSGVRTRNDDQYFAPTVVASFNPKLLPDKMRANILRPVYKERLMEAEDTFGLYVAFYKIDSAKELAVDNFVVYDDVYGITLAATLNCDGDKQILCVFLTDSDLHLPNTDAEKGKRAEEKLRILEEIIYRLYPGLREKTVLLDYLKPWSFERYTKTVNGSAYGIKKTVSSFGFHHRVPIAGLYLVGQGLYPGFLGSLISGFGLACELFEADKFWSKVVEDR